LICFQPPRIICSLFTPPPRVAATLRHYRLSFFQIVAAMLIFTPRWRCCRGANIFLRRYVMPRPRHARRRRHFHRMIEGFNQRMRRTHGERQRRINGRGMHHLFIGFFRQGNATETQSRRHRLRHKIETASVPGSALFSTGAKKAPRQDDVPRHMPPRQNAQHVSPTRARCRRPRPPRLQLRDAFPRFQHLYHDDV